MTVPLSDLKPAIPLRLATLQDTAGLAYLWRAAWSSANPAAPSVAPIAHWEERVAAEFGAPNTTLVYEHDHALRAFMVLDLHINHLHQLFVAPDAQSQGLGGVLVREIGRSYCPAGWTLHVATSNQRAREFYARCGLVEEAVSVHPQTGRERVLCRWRPTLQTAIARIA
ncbi:MAG: GNAT family N-acetyltransferase [Acidovorax sp.]|nr:MAG: GNAT family N-acetyltransferase [Acidovorax sp.]